ncbi:MAG: queuosine precursor transporter [bacterium]
MNELIFLLHIMFVVGFTFLAFRIGKSALIVFVCLQAVLANLFVVKQMNILGLNATCADVFIIGSILGINLIQEYYGKDAAEETIKISFFAMFFYLIMSQVHLFYLPNSFDNAHDLFEGILKFAPRITIASVFAYFVVLIINNKFYAYLKNSFKDKYLFLRNFISIMLTQLLDTFIFVFAALYGIVGSVWQVMFVSLVLKVIVISLSTPFVELSKKLFSKKIVENGNK